jgi:Short C-terminal domain
MTHDRPDGTPQVTAGLPVPAMPHVQSAELHAGPPVLLAAYGVRHSMGWQDNRADGPGFVLTRLRPLGGVKVVERFPLTEEGWAEAWHVLVARDSDAAAAIARTLARRVARGRAQTDLDALDGGSLGVLRSAAFTGGSDGARLTTGRLYDLRFLADRFAVCPARSPDPILAVPYAEIEAVDISGSHPGRAPGDVLVLCFIFGLLGAALGLLLFGLLGMFLGALIFGVIGAALGSSQAGTTVRVRGRDVELYFAHGGVRQDAVRIQLSDSLLAIGKAGAVLNAADQLVKLGTLLEQGLITRDEFDQLKAKLLAQP